MITISLEKALLWGKMSLPCVALGTYWLIIRLVILSSYHKHPFAVDMIKSTPSASTNWHDKILFHQFLNVVFIRYAYRCQAIRPPNHNTRGPIVPTPNPTSGVEVAIKEITGYMQRANLWLHSMPSLVYKIILYIYLRNTETLKFRHLVIYSPFILKKLIYCPRQHWCVHVCIALNSSYVRSMFSPPNPESMNSFYYHFGRSMNTF